jgi:hypothetical protein
MAPTLALISAVLSHRVLPLADFQMLVHQLENSPPLLPTENENADSNSILSSSNAPHSEVTKPIRSYVATLRSETTSYLPLIVDANSPPHGASRTTTRRLSRRCSQPLGSSGHPKTTSGSDPKEHDIPRYDADPGTRAPRPGQLHDGRELTASDVEVKEPSSKVTGEDHAILRYHADPGPRAPRPGQFYDAREFRILNAELPAKVIDASYLKRQDSAD